MSWSTLLLALLLIADPQALRATSHPELGANYAAPAGVGHELIGTRAPEWMVSEWLDGQTRTLASLRGKVLLVRWWTAPGCPYCAASAEGIDDLRRKYRGRGLEVIGMYHHKAPSPLTREHVASQARRLGFDFPVAIDADWKTLRHWWLDRQDRGWTSVTFVIDREGVIRQVHPGGAFFPGEPGFKALEEAIHAAL